MTTIDTTGLRTRAQSTAKAGGDIHIAPGSFLALLDARDRAEAERDYRRRENAELRDELVATQEYGAKLAHGKDEAEERIEAVQALHTGTRWPGVTDKPICDACDRPWPCDTIRALDGDA